MGTLKKLREEKIDILQEDLAINKKKRTYSDAIALVGFVSTLAAINYTDLVILWLWLFVVTMMAAMAGIFTAVISFGLERKINMIQSRPSNRPITNEEMAVWSVEKKKEKKDE